MSFDSKTWADHEIPGLTWLATVGTDEYYEDEPEGDGYTPKQVAAFREGSWWYVYLRLVPYVDGVRMGAYAAATGCVEYGDVLLTTEDDVVTGWCYCDPLAEKVRTYLIDEDGTYHSGRYEEHSNDEYLTDLRASVLEMLGDKLPERIASEQQVLTALATMGLIETAGC